MNVNAECRAGNDRQVHEEYVAPEVNIFETNDAYFLEAEMPGVGKDGLEINLDGSEITITGRRNVASPSGEAIVRERRAADFSRVFELDPAIDTARISARMEQGVLALSLPKSERVIPRRIAVE
jgi:HSP20 family protein